jgi:AraC family transcriptional regulator of arabinose operon
LVSDYYEVRPGYHILRRKGSPSTYLIYSIAGRGFVRDRHDRVLYLDSGDFALISRHTYQEYGIAPCCSLWRCHWVHFDVQPDWSNWAPLAGETALEGVSHAHVSSSALRQQIGELFFEMHASPPGNEAWRFALRLNLLERVLILTRSASDDARARFDDPRVAKVLQLIESRAPEVPSPRELGSAVGLSPSRLACVFKQQTGVSMMGAVNRLRLRAARHALMDSAVGMQQVAERAGFQSPYSFSNWFLKQTGERPASYRRKCRRSAIEVP